MKISFTLDADTEEALLALFGPAPTTVDPQTWLTSNLGQHISRCIAKGQRRLGVAEVDALGLELLEDLKEVGKSADEEARKEFVRQRNEERMKDPEYAARKKAAIARKKQQEEDKADFERLEAAREAADRASLVIED